MIEIDKKSIAERVMAVSKASGFNLKGFADELGVPYSTLQKYSKGVSKPTAQLYIALFDYGIDLHWFISGQGEMFRALKSTPDTKKTSYSYKGNNVAVHNNHGTVTTGIQESEAEGRGSQICAWVTEYMQTHDDDECVWLDIQMRKLFPEYAEFQKGRK